MSDPVYRTAAAVAILAFLLTTMAGAAVVINNPSAGKQFIQIVQNEVVGKVDARDPAALAVETQDVAGGVRQLGAARPPVIAECLLQRRAPRPGRSARAPRPPRGRGRAPASGAPRAAARSRPRPPPAAGPAERKEAAAANKATEKTK